MSLLKSFYNSQYFLLVVITAVIWFSLAAYITWAYQQVHAEIMTQNEYHQSITQLRSLAQLVENLSAALKNEQPQSLPPEPTYQQFCALYELNTTQHCE